MPIPDPPHSPPDDDPGRVSATVKALTTDVVAVPQIELRVERERGEQADRTVVLQGDLFRVGSHPANDLVLDDPRVSRFHFSLMRTPTGFRVMDSGSQEGTRVDGITVRDADLPLPVSTIEAGDSTLRVRDLGVSAQLGIAPAQRLGNLVGASVPMRLLFEMVKRAAAADIDVLIEGESGTGKELCASEIVRLGPRAGGPLVVVDCGAVSPRLIESEFFGHVRGSFTGAERDREGAFEQADGGTLFLDEIGELPLEMQPKLLRALAAREVRRIGDNRVRRIDVRVIAATNRKLEREVNAGRFREDLYYRLSVLTLRVPPLRERPGDIPLLVEQFSRERDAAGKYLFPPELVDELMMHEWPGNVRELKNWVERRIVFERDALPPGRPPDAPASQPAAAWAASIERPFKEAKDEVIGAFERAYLIALDRWAGGNVSKAARKAQIDRISVHRLLQRHGLRGARSFD